MNKNLIGRLVALGLVVTSIVGFGTVSYDTATSGSLSSKINELKQLALDWKNNATAKDKLISEKEQALAELQGRYDSILRLLGLEAGASDEDIQNAIEGKQDIGDIATALGLEAGAGKQDILNKIAEINQEIAQLEGAISDLESVVGQLTAEIERLQGEVNKANNTEQVMLEELMVTIEDIGTPVVGEEGEEEEEELGNTTGKEEVGTGNTTGKEDVGPSLEELKATMDSAWSDFEAYCANNNFYKTADVKQGKYTITGDTTINVAGMNKTVEEEFFTLLNAWEQAKTNYLNAGGTLE